METATQIKDTVVQKGQELVSGEKKEVHEGEAKNSDNSITDRASHGVDAAKEKVSETSHGAQHEASKQDLKN